MVDLDFQSLLLSFDFKKYILNRYWFILVGVQSTVDFFGWIL